MEYAEAIGVVFLDRELECYLWGLEGRSKEEGGMVMEKRGEYVPFRGRRR